MGSSLHALVSTTQKTEVAIGMAGLNRLLSAAPPHATRNGMGSTRVIAGEGEAASGPYPCTNANLVFIYTL